MIKRPAASDAASRGDAAFYGRLAVNFAPEDTEAQQVAAELGR